MKTLLAICADPKMHVVLKKKMNVWVDRMLKANPDLVLGLYDERITERSTSIFHHVAIARNRLIEKFLTPDIDNILWADADLVEVPANLPELLYAPNAVVAPLVLIEDQKIFYDVAAFVQKGVEVFDSPPHFGNFSHHAPFARERGDKIPCECVGCCYMIPAEVYRKGCVHRATGFTDHWPAIRAAIDLGCECYTTRKAVVYHARLPKYREKWHCENMQQHFHEKWFGLPTTSINRNSPKGEKHMLG